MSCSHRPQVHEADVAEAFGVYLPGEALPYRMLDAFIVCRADDVSALVGKPATPPACAP